jgi:hypothetical protein
VRFVSSFIANVFVGKVRAAVLMGVVFPSYAVAGQENMGLCNGIGGLNSMGEYSKL